MQNKKEYLKQYLLMQKKINRINQMLFSHPENKNEYIKQIKKCESFRKEIDEKITNVGGIEAEVLFLKYACGKTLLEVSYIINYSLRQTERLHKKALEKFNL